MAEIHGRNWVLLVGAWDFILIAALVGRGPIGNDVGLGVAALSAVVSLLLVFFADVRIATPNWPSSQPLERERRIVQQIQFASFGALLFGGISLISTLLWLFGIVG